MPLGTKQGGIISPKLFSLYIDDIVKILKRSGVGCNFVEVFVGCILFADDMVLLAPSRGALQRLIDLCNDFFSMYCLSFNARKSKIMVFGKGCLDTPKPLSLNGSLIDFTNEWKYLGTTVKAGRRLGFASQPDLAAFYRATNSILHSLPGAHEHILITLLYCNCVPILTYACSVKEYSATEMSNCNTAVNNALRKVFGFTRWESIRSLRECFGMKSLYDIFKTCQDKFIVSCRYHHNSVISSIASHLLV